MELSTTGTGRTHTQDALSQHAVTVGLNRMNRSLKSSRLPVLDRKGGKVYGQLGIDPVLKEAPDRAPTHSLSLHLPISPRLPTPSPMPSTGCVSREAQSLEQRVGGGEVLTWAQRAVKASRTASCDHLNSVPKATDPEGHALLSGVTEQSCSKARKNRTTKPEWP